MGRSESIFTATVVIVHWFCLSTDLTGFVNCGLRWHSIMSDWTKSLVGSMDTGTGGIITQFNLQNQTKLAITMAVAVLERLHCTLGQLAIAPQLLTTSNGHTG